MPNTPNKIKYGLSDCYYAVATIGSDGTATYGSPKPIPGAVNLSLEPQGENSPFYADNIVYYVSSVNQGYQGDFEMAVVPESFKKDILGYIVDGKDILFENAEAEAVHFALIFRFQGDLRATKHVLYNCTVTRPTQAGATKTDTVEPQTETLTITATTVKNSVLGKNVVKAETVADSNAGVYSDWEVAVYTGTATT